MTVHSTPQETQTADSQGIILDAMRVGSLAQLAALKGSLPKIPDSPEDSLVLDRDSLAAIHGHVAELQSLLIYP